MHLSAGKSHMEHIRAIDPNEAWKTGAAGVLRIRGILICSSTDVVLTVLSHFLLGWQVAIVVLAVGLLTVVALLLFRRVRLRDFWLGVRMHNLFHYMRNDAEQVIAPFDEEDIEAALTKYGERYRAYHNDQTDRIADFFRCLLQDESVNCAIRLADIRDGNRVYVTWGRSKRMDPSRQDHSQPVPSEGSIAAAILRHDEMGVYYVPNVREVSAEDKEDKWADDPDCQLHDVTALMVAPINTYGSSSSKKFMLGLLYITSGRSGISPLCVEPLKAIADALGFVYPRITVGEKGKDTGDANPG